MEEHPLDRLHPVAGPAAGFALGLAPVAVIASGYPFVGVGLGLGLAGAGWAVARRGLGRSSPLPDTPTAAEVPSDDGWVGAPGELADEEPTGTGPAAPPPPLEIAPSGHIHAVASEARPAMVRVAGGTYTIGSPSDDEGRDGDEPQRQVRLTADYLMAQTQVTQAQYARVMGSNPSGFTGADRPVEDVSWLDAVTYCNALSELEGLPQAYTINGADVQWDRWSLGYRLPTEAEWEVAARAGSAAARHGPLDAVAWHEGNSGGQTHPVKGKAPNAWGLHDMLGNVYEWVWDRYESSPPSQSIDPAGPTHGVRRVIRGGSSFGSARWVRAAGRRGWWGPDDRDGDLGFRPARSAPRTR